MNLKKSYTTSPAYVSELKGGSLARYQGRLVLLRIPDPVCSIISGDHEEEGCNDTIMNVEIVGLRSMNTTQIVSAGMNSVD
jgi:hypothetical protein